MSDIVERLRQWNSASLRRDGSKLTVMAEAADAIEARDAEIERLRAERDTFYMDYRIKCDEETKRLRAEASNWQALSEANAQVAEALGAIYTYSLDGVSLHARIRAALGDEPADDAPRKQP